jgi:hypothetical protein
MIEDVSSYFTNGPSGLRIYAGELGGVRAAGVTMQGSSRRATMTSSALFDVYFGWKLQHFRFGWKEKTTS